jgi:UDP-N-acetylmuramyl pentapeptide phosphotransferase/UDP-N-acetylglucosamine-1-phosphate transferase
VAALAKVRRSRDVRPGDIDKLMEGKKGTPTMGGLLIISAIAFTTLLLADLQNFYVLMGLICLIGLGAIGASDDWLKLTAGRKAGSRTGLPSGKAHRPSRLGDRHRDVHLPPRTGE